MTFDKRLYCTGIVINDYTLEYIYVNPNLELIGIT